MVGKRGGRQYYDEDDYYDGADDEDDYNDEDYDAEATPTVSGDVEDVSAERELLMAVMPQVKKMLHKSVPDAAIEAAIRAANYDPVVAVDSIAKMTSTVEPVRQERVAACNLPPRVLGNSSPQPPMKRPEARDSVSASARTPEPQPSPQPQPSETPPPHVTSSVTSSTASSPVLQHKNIFFPHAEHKTGAEVSDGDGKVIISLVMAGHVDTGKSTILGHLLVKLGHFSARDVTKMVQQATREGKPTFHFAWILDQSEEERRRGVTIESGMHSFETPHRRVCVLDAPGHQDYVRSMISSAAQADVALFTVSAATGEFESGLQHMTREHLLVLRTLGVPQIVVLVNKMDKVDYSQTRFNEVVSKISEMVGSIGFPDGCIVGYCPISGYLAVNLLPDTPLPPELSSWYSGKSLIEYVDECSAEKRMLNYPLRMFISDVAKPSSISGKVETGILSVGSAYIVLPSGKKVTVKSIERHLVGQVKTATAGCFVDIVVNGDLTDVCAGDVLCPAKQLCPCGTNFEAHIELLPTLKKAIIPGSNLSMLMHAVNTPVVVRKLLRRIDPETGTWATSKTVKCLGPDSQGLVELELPHATPLELAEDNRKLGRFLLCQEDIVVGGGLVRAVHTLSGTSKPNP